MAEMKPRGYWTLERILEESREIICAEGDLPSESRFREIGRYDLLKAIKRHGGLRKIRDTLGLKQRRKEDGYWTEETILAEAREVIKDHGYIPPQKEMYSLGRADLWNQLILHGGVEHFRNLLGLDSLQKPAGFWQDESNVMEEVEKVKGENGLERMPSQAKLKKMGHTSLVTAIDKYHGGFYEFRKRLGEEPLEGKKGYLKDWENVSTMLQEIISEIGHFPSQSELIGQRRQSLSSAISKYHGGLPATRERMGYGQIRTEEQLEIFLQNNPSARAISSLVDSPERAGDIAEILVGLWPKRFPSALELSKSLPGAIKHIGHSLHPFSMDKARGFYEDAYAVPREIKYVLDDILYNIAIDQYQVSFSKNPEKTLQELGDFASQDNGIKKLAERVLNYYKEISSFSIPGHGTLQEASCQ